MQTLMRREHGKRVLTLDPNVRPSLIEDRARYLRRLTEWVSLVDLVKLSSADLDWLYPGVDHREIAMQWLRTGPALVLVTKGGHGSAAYGRAAHAEVPGVRITLADTVGAGDSFMSAALGHLHENGLLHRERLAALDESRLAALLRSATAVSALTCTRVGADPPWRRELEGWPV
jgi:fructokinase